MRYLFGILCVCALGLMPLVGCSETAGTGGSGGTSGDGGSAGDGGEGGTAGNGGTAGSGGTVGSGGAGGDGGTGGAVVCAEKTDCFSPNDCIDYFCADGICIYSDEPREKSCDLGDGVHHGVCDGAGTCLECSEDEQCDDFKDCTSSGCSNGVCDHPPVADGTLCAGGTCRAGVCELTDSALPCTEQGIRNAIATGGDERYTFDCDGPTTVFIKAELVIDNNVILDGEGNLTVDGSKMEIMPFGLEPITIFRVRGSVTCELRGFEVTHSPDNGILITPYRPANAKLTLVDSTVWGNPNDGISGSGDRTLILVRSTVSGNTGSGIGHTGTLTLIDSTVVGNPISGEGEFTLVNSTVSGNSARSDSGIVLFGGTVRLSNSTISDSIHAGTLHDPEDPFDHPRFVSIVTTATLINGACIPEGDGVTWTSDGYNIESPGDTCGFDQLTDQVNVSADDLKLEPLADNGGPTMTHALGAGSVAIDHIPAVDCGVTEDQRGLPRPGAAMCDVGAFEVQP